MSTAAIVDPSILWQLLRLFASVSMVAIGGANAVVPAIRHEVVDILHWMDAATFSHLYAIAQAAPGPNVLISSLVGWQVAGFSGLLVATVAMVLPPCLLAYMLALGLGRVSGTNGFRLVQDALVPLAIGLIIASGLDIARSANVSWPGYVITLVTGIWIYATRINPVWPLLTAAAAGIICHACGLPVL